jgi:hypothetical protein
MSAKAAKRSSLADRLGLQTGLDVHSREFLNIRAVGVVAKKSGIHRTRTDTDAAAETNARGDSRPLGAGLCR